MVCGIFGDLLPSALTDFPKQNKRAFISWLRSSTGYGNKCIPGSKTTARSPLEVTGSFRRRTLCPMEEYTSPFAARSFAWFLPLHSQRYSMGIAWMKMIPQFVLIFNYGKSITFWQLIQMTRNSFEILGFSFKFPFIPMPCFIKDK